MKFRWKPIIRFDEIATWQLQYKNRFGLWFPYESKLFSRSGFYEYVYTDTKEEMDSMSERVTDHVLRNETHKRLATKNWEC